MEQNPLVSIIVITYNSAKYVLETLESAKAQTYKNIELIISDDASSDDTIEVCKCWLKENEDRFFSTNLIVAKKNSGIPANCNQGIKASKGIWIKLIAGDDVFHKDAIKILIDAIFNGSNNEFYCSNYFVIDEKSEITDEVILNNRPYFTFTNSYEQFQMALRISGTVPPLTAIYSRKMYDQCGGFDEEYKLLEDYPFFLKLNQLGYKAMLIKEKLAYYRKSENSVTSTKKGHIFHPIFLYTYRFQKEYCVKFVSQIEQMGFRYQYYLAFFFNKYNLNAIKYKNYYYALLKLNPYSIKRFFWACANKRYYSNR